MKLVRDVEGIRNGFWRFISTKGFPRKALVLNGTSASWIRKLKR